MLSTILADESAETTGPVAAPSQWTRWQAKPERTLAVGSSPSRRREAPVRCH
jgi:hypothetical protein